MEKYMHRENIKLYRKVLADTADQSKINIILELIRAEMSKERAQQSAAEPALQGLFF
jgi:hypothetical protein